MSGSGSVQRVLVFGDQISDGSGGTRYAEIKALVKENTPASPHTVANEAIATGLAHAIGLPVPAGGIVATDEGLAWASWHIGLGGQRPPPVIPALAVRDQPVLCAFVVAFDCWIDNHDRHEGNLAYLHEQLPLAALDHGHALLGPDVQGLARLLADRNRASVRGCLHDHLHEAADLQVAASEIGGVPTRRIERIVASVQQSGACDATMADHLVDFLDHRKTRIMALLQASAPEFTRITQWSLT